MKEAITLSSEMTFIFKPACLSGSPDTSIVCQTALIACLSATGIWWRPERREVSPPSLWPLYGEARCRPVTSCHAPVIMSEWGNCHTSAGLTSSAEVQRLQGVKSFQCTKWISIIEFSRAVEYWIKLAAPWAFDVSWSQLSDMKISALSGQMKGTEMSTMS